MIATSPLVPWSDAQSLPRGLWLALAAIACAAAIVLLVVPPVRRFAWWTGDLDHPEARKLHTHATPLLGGVCVALGSIGATAIGIAVLHIPFPAHLWWWAAGAVAALGLGLVDDKFGMHPLPKLFLQIAVGLVFLCGGVYPTGGPPPSLCV